ncbi:TonB-dependent receptor [Desulfosarcina ovata subsp. sediminis]|uniref:TonB-dependent receptor n=1 Tax=Desulfosarcina ovata subsp. sediminis TaxID=885957 RepID=A0A5K7ZMG0_9BACT|nr:TonB-dependent receptor [Desulfosarcina ovata]BBO82396.1 TonB-dependent receptor [Desulfosarcina ovata subsp. sediminis]
MKRLIITWCVFVLFLVVPIIAVEPSFSQEASDETSEQPYKLEDVVVRGDLSQKNLDASSSEVLTSEKITNRVYDNPVEIIGLVPGVSINQYKQGGTASSLQMRGFTSVSHGSDAAFYIDGIPLNEGDGYADTNIVNPEELERVEVIKGPISPLYGNYASAGVVHFHTKNKVDHQHVKLQYGAYDTYEGNYVGGFTSKDGKTDHVYSFMTYHTDGYQDNSDWDKLNGAARITHHLTDDLNIRLSLRGFNSDWDAPGWLNEEEYEDDPEKSVNDANGGSKDYKSGKIDVDYMLSSDSKLLFQLWSYDQNFVRYYAGRDEGVAVGTNIGNVRDFDRLAYGSNVSYNFLGDLLGRQMSFTAGADYMMEDIDRNRWRLTAGNGREKGEKYIDYHIDFESIGIYTDINYQVIDPLKIIIGGRYDHFTGDLTDHLLDDQESSMDDTDIFSPKGGLLITLLDDRLELFGNYSRGFAMMSGFAEQAQYTQDSWDPQIRTQYEIGMRVRPVDWFNGQLIGFRLDTTDDFIQDPVTSEYENKGETRRDGIELTLDFYAFDFGYLHCDYSYIDATYEDYSSGGVSYDGNDLSGVPTDIVNIEIGYNPVTGFGGRLRYHYQDGGMLDDANTLKGESWDKIDANIFYRFGNDPRYTIALEVLNVFDEKYPACESYWSGSTSYSPGLPLSAYLSFTVDF